jgi:uncharacterized membrane protein
MAKTEGRRPEPSQTEVNEPEDQNSAPSSEILPPEIGTVLRSAGVNTEDPNVIRAVQISVTMASGSLPLPPGSVLAEYDRAVPGLASTLIELIKDQRGHRQALERAADRRMNISQYSSIFVIILGLCIAGWLGYRGLLLVPSIIAIISVGGPTAAIWFARNSRLLQNASLADGHE